MRECPAGGSSPGGGPFESHFFSENQLNKIVAQNNVLWNTNSDNEAPHYSVTQIPN